jgi:hypothetical protein
VVEPGNTEFDGHSECWLVHVPDFFSANTLVGAVVDERVLIP